MIKKYFSLKFCNNEINKPKTKSKKKQKNKTKKIIRQRKGKAKVKKCQRNLPK